MSTSGDAAAVLQVVGEADEAGRLDGRADLDRPTRRPKIDRADLVDGAFALVGAAAMATLLRVVLDWRGIMSTAIWFYVLFLVFFYLLVRDRTSDEAAIDRIITIIIWSVAGVVVALLGWMIVFLAAKGLKLLRTSFLTHDMRRVGPLNPGGGVRHAIIGTFEQVGLATVVVVPIAVLTAVYLHEIKGRMSGVIRFIVDAMSGLPSIVAGLLVFTLWVLGGHGFSGIAASAALAVLMLPIVTRTSEEILRTIPDPLREASLALGAPQWRVVRRIVLPTALSGLMTAIILGVARAVGETAPVLLTTLASDRTNVNLVKGPQSDLPLFVWQLIREPFARQNDRAWAAAFTLVVLVLLLFAVARLIAARSQRKLGRSS
jgi:phosphate transport system permease protein